MKFFERVARRKFSKFLHFFARFWRNICVLSTLNARFFETEHIFVSVNFSDVSLSMCSARWPDARKFCARGAPKFQEFCNSFARSGRKTLRDLDADRALFRWQRTRDLFKSFKDVIRFFATHAECTQLLCARRAKFFRKFYNFFLAILAHNVRDLDVRFFGSARTADSFHFSNVVQYAQRMPAGCTQLLCARRAGFPKILQFFRAILAQNLREVDAGLALFSHLNALKTRSRVDDVLWFT